MDFINFIIYPSYFCAIYFLVYWLLVFVENISRIKKEYSEKIKLSRYPLVSVLVPAWNEEKTVRKTLFSLSKLDWPKDKIEIIVINDGSTDKTSQVVKTFMSRHPKENIILHEQENKGKGASLNVGLKILKGEFFTCLDADSFVESQTLKHMIHWHLKEDDVAITTPIMKIYKPKTFIQKLQRLEYISGMFLTKLMSYIDSNYVAPGPFSTYKTKIIREMGGFDEDNLVEDQEIAYRAQLYHHRIIQVPNAIVNTVGPSTFKKFRSQRNRWYKGTILNIIKYRKMMFKKEYGHFGMYQLPIVNVLAFIMGIFALGLFINYSIVPIFQQLHRLWLVNFDIMPYLKLFQLNFDLLSVNALSSLIFGVSVLMGVVFLLFSGRVNKDKLLPYFFYIIFFFLFYFIIMAYIIVLVMGELVIGKKQRW